MIAKHGRHGVTRYTHDLLDRITTIQRQPNAAGAEFGILPNELTFEYDALGRLVAETSDGQRVESQHDALGNLTECRPPLGQRLSTLYYGSGHVHQINVDGQTISDFERDALHREVLRTQGTRKCETTYDERGRTRSLFSSLSGPGGMGANRLLGAAYQYDLAGNLNHVSRYGAGANARTSIHYAYDAMGRMTGCHDDALGLHESYIYDAADNLIEATRDRGASQLLDDLLNRFQQTHYEYNGFGQLTRRTANGLAQDFVYDDDGQMVAASGQGLHGKHTTTFQYDAIGRRTAKTTSRFAADGDLTLPSTPFVS